MNLTMNGKTVLVTGGSSGIGESIVRHFAREGANVLFTYRENCEGAHQIISELRNEGLRAECFDADLSKEDDIARLFEKIKPFYKKLDILINNAGRTFNVSFFDYTQETLLCDLETNLISAMLCSRYAVEMMKDGGNIINTTSIRGMDNAGRPGIMGYSAAKAGVISFTKNLALELAPKICVNAVAPGFVLTNHLDLNTTEERKKQWLENIPLGHFTDPGRLAEVYEFLALTKEITGTVIPVDGGYMLLNR